MKKILAFLSIISLTSITMSTSISCRIVDDGTKQILVKGKKEKIIVSKEEISINNINDNNSILASEKFDFQARSSNKIISKNGRDDVENFLNFLAKKVSNFQKIMINDFGIISEMDSSFWNCSFSKAYIDYKMSIFTLLTRVLTDTNNLAIWYFQDFKTFDFYFYIQTGKNIIENKNNERSKIINKVVLTLKNQLKNIDYQKEEIKINISKEYFLEIKNKGSKLLKKLSF